MGQDAGVLDDARLSDGAVDRRTLIKGAAAAGALAWTAPVVIDSLTSPAGAQATPGVGCFKFMYNWCWATELEACIASGAISNQFAQNAPFTECTQQFGENTAGRTQPDPNCCQTNPATAWNQQPDIAGCITVTGSSPFCTCPDPGSTMTVTITSTCPNCWLADLTVAHWVPPTTGTPCPSVSTSNAGSSVFTRQYVINFSNDREPIWFKAWVGCGLSVCSPQTVPCTQDSCLPGADCDNTPDDQGPCASLTVSVT